jgi:dihydropteroate synthase
MLAASGADILDIGGESTRPGAARTGGEELRRVVPVIRVLARELPVPLSVDTTKAEVARAALDAGAEVVNDVSGGLFDPAIVRVAEAAGAAYVCGHVRGDSLAAVHAAEASPPSYDEVAFELGRGCPGPAGGLRHRTIVDPVSRLRQGHRREPRAHPAGRRARSARSAARS